MLQTCHPLLTKGSKMEDNDIYLTDEQYLDLLKKVREDLNRIKKIVAIDSDQTGNKHTFTNCGLCTGYIGRGECWSRDTHVTMETALFPEDFKKKGKTRPYPQQFSMKYRKDQHRCPLDSKKGSRDAMASGCFYRCMIFQRKFRTPTIKEMKRMYDKIIQKAEACAG